MTQDDVADQLWWGLWRSIDENYKERYFLDVWEHFENAIRAAAYTGSLKEFLSKIKQRISMVIQAQFNAEILQVVESGDDDQVLDWLRSETTYLVMVCRVRNQERKQFPVGSGQSAVSSPQSAVKSKN
jgi:hypothetical protein